MSAIADCLRQYLSERLPKATIFDDYAKDYTINGAPDLIEINPNAKSCVGWTYIINVQESRLIAMKSDRNCQRSFLHFCLENPDSIEELVKDIEAWIYHLDEHWQ
jgi:hypothetical protein